MRDHANDYLVPRSPETRIDAPTPQWKRMYPLLVVEILLAYIAVGWAGVGFFTGISHTASPAGNAFGAAAKFVGSWQVLTGLLLATAVISITGLAFQYYRLRRIGLGLGAFCWGFIAAGLSTNGFVSTAVVVYPALCVLAIFTLITVPGSGRDR